MTRSEIRYQVRSTIVTELRCPIARVVDNAEFEADLGASTLDKISIVCGLENAFGIKLSDGEAAFCKTVGTAIDLVETKVENRQLLPRLREAGL